MFGILAAALVAASACGQSDDEAGNDASISVSSYTRVLRSTNPITTSYAPLVNAIAVGESPRDLALNRATRILFVTDFDEETVSWVDIATRQVIATLAVGYYPAQMAVNPKTDTLYLITHEKGPRLIAIDTETRTVTQRFTFDADSLTASPASVSVDPDNNRLYVALEGRKSFLATIDTVTRKVIGTLPIPDSSGAMVADLDQRIVYVSSGDTIAVVDLAINSITTTIPGTEDPGLLILDAAGHRLYVTDGHGKTVSVIDTVARKVIASIEFDRTVGALALDGARHILYCATEPVWKAPTDVVTAVDTRTNKISQTIPIDGNYLYGLLVDEPSNSVYVTVGTRNAVMAFPRI
ncbi:YncE family protein [Nocardia sp. NBC_01503]|uniref:YncE family protein n=1 Tax=Nocardia sp. NBC_01503 TaxID=2975997 RepID=UPI002E7BD831|nr:YncE family protein [Nocardia sp. NBC_01503]WTL30158.1 YncE family protein [Nocardia sp. NBC_01503]